MMEALMVVLVVVVRGGLMVVVVMEVLLVVVECLYVLVKVGKVGDGGEEDVVMSG